MNWSRLALRNLMRRLVGPRGSFGVGSLMVLGVGGDETISPFGLCKAVIIPDIHRKSRARLHSLGAVRRTLAAVQLGEARRGRSPWRLSSAYRRLLPADSPAQRRRPRSVPRTRRWRPTTRWPRPPA